MYARDELVSLAVRDVLHILEARDLHLTARGLERRGHGASIPGSRPASPGPVEAVSAADSLKHMSQGGHPAPAQNAPPAGGAAGAAAPINYGEMKPLSGFPTSNVLDALRAGWRRVQISTADDVSVPDDDVDSDSSESFLARRDAIGYINDLVKRGGTAGKGEASKEPSEARKEQQRIASQNYRAKKTQEANAEREKLRAAGLDPSSYKRPSGRSEAATQARKDDNPRRKAEARAKQKAAEDARAKDRADKDAAKEKAWNELNEPHDYDGMQPVKQFPESFERGGTKGVGGSPKDATQ
ncbi:hypothetical protein EIP91_004024 [Steccherinum ochraceum]|uniref:Uncharacterized protein n=1 Tax=Steccherinum ochraceum TaxID=92696 RepID=A0A4R0RC24_9APHY|nr:hypothetical protein EIP91_004024 [Steccherinum ochraceum]